LVARGIHTIEVGVAEAPCQSALFTAKVPNDEAGMQEIEKLISKFRPQPCLDGDKDVET